jgi:hypothetical protein
MNDQVELPEVSDDEILAGQKTVTTLLRTGKQTEVLVRALPWRTALQASALLGSGDAGSGTIMVLQSALAAEFRRDSFLDQVVPSELVRLSQLALILSNGVPQKKVNPVAQPG